MEATDPRERICTKGCSIQIGTGNLTDIIGDVGVAVGTKCVVFLITDIHHLGSIQTPPM